MFIPQQQCDGVLVESVSRMAGASRCRFNREYLGRDFRVFGFGLESRRLANSRERPMSCSSRRGEIRGFSAHSRLRLRRALVSSTLPDCAMVCGLTLTLPWRVPHGVLPCFYNRVNADFRMCFNRFGVMFRRKFAFSAAIFRIELQQRKMPHVHLIVYLSRLDLEGRSFADLQVILQSMWVRSVVGCRYDCNLSAFFGVGVRLQRLAGDSQALLRYLCDHASKRKQAQLGYRGKQWGYLNRRLIVCDQYFNLPFDDLDLRAVLVRHVERVCRTFVKAKCAFGCKLSRRHSGRSVLFVSRRTVRDLCVAIADGRICCGSDYAAFAFLS